MRSLADEVDPAIDLGTLYPRKRRPTLPPPPDSTALGLKALKKALKLHPPPPLRRVEVQEGQTADQKTATLLAAIDTARPPPPVSCLC
jgi:hypothetical protein